MSTVKKASAKIEPWQIDRMRDKVEEMTGRLNVLVYTPSRTVFRVWFNPDAKVALYGKIVWDAEHEKERLTKAWPDRVRAALNAEGTVVHVNYRNSRKKSKWFGGEADMRPMSELYEYAMSFASHSTGDKKP